MTKTYQIERRKRGVIGWIFLVLFWLFNAVLLLSLLGGLSNVGSLDPGASSAGRTGAAIGTTIGVTMILTIWAAGAVVLGMMVLLTRGPKIIETVNPPEAAIAANAEVGEPPVAAAKPANLALPVGIAVVVIVALVAIMLQPPRLATAPTIAAVDATPPASFDPRPTSATPLAPASNWSYRTSADEMRGTSDRFATVTSSNTVNFGFPYDDARMTITLRDTAKFGRDILLEIHDGQFQCRYDGCTINAKFDDGPVQSFSMLEAESSSDTIFFQNQTRILAALRKAKKVMIEASFYSHGTQQFSFDVEGLEWK